MNHRKTPIALFGAGAIGRTHIDRLQRSDRASLAGIADPTEGGRAAAEAAGVPWFADHRALLEAVRPAGAIIATPNATHVSIALDCLSQGVAVLVEKPVADTVVDAERLVAAEAQYRVPVLIGHHRRHNPVIRRAREIVSAGRLGRIVAVNALATFLKPDSYFETSWRRQHGGGPVLINLIHDIDLLRFLVGEIESVQAVDSHATRGFEVEDSAAAVLRFSGGAIGTVIVSDCVTAPWCWDFCAGESPAYPRQTVQSHFIAGTHGSLSLPDLALWQYPGERGWHEELTREQSVVHQRDPYERQLAHFADLIEGRETDSLCSALDGMRTLAATRAVLEAAAKAPLASDTLTLPVNEGRNES
ncbi:Gfo/Idh/MocA family protein [Variovorax sp. Sphag1AA]|uniref:Gfo/Idh/MocA family protein n=1 Tax=Variovorax sp. Sphag1AA TaxID=2587027 RepID=UPI00161BCA6D|nr:Gfo/Idh/MocA family oxidoreductase [Variovorax sp. Sphag1AA]MBB3178657.1 putative dehydrogenase [Variovorax sp. Sphag1AA]